MNDAYSWPQQAEKKINFKSCCFGFFFNQAQAHLISKSIAVSNQTEVLVQLQTGNYLQGLDEEQAHQGILLRQSLFFLFYCSLLDVSEINTKN